MSNHDQNHYGLARAADRALTRLFLIAIFGASCFAVGWFSGEQRGLKEGKAMVKPCPKPVVFRDLTAKQIARWNKWRESEARGWVIK